MFKGRLKHGHFVPAGTKKELLLKKDLVF